jgi:ketosteroid isomerase-like protein
MVPRFIRPELGGSHSQLMSTVQQCSSAGGQQVCGNLGYSTPRSTVGFGELLSDCGRCDSLAAMSSSAQPALQQIRLAMARTNDLFNTEVFGKRNFDALNEIYTDDARILPPGAPMISGRKEIKEFWSNLLQSMNAKSAVLASVDVVQAGDGAVEIGRATLTIEPPGQAAVDIDVKYVVYWKQEGGQWKWHIDIWNQNS